MQVDRAANLLSDSVHVHQSRHDSPCKMRAHDKISNTAEYSTIHIEYSRIQENIIPNMILNTAEYSTTRFLLKPDLCTQGAGAGKTTTAILLFSICLLVLT